MNLLLGNNGNFKVINVTYTALAALIAASGLRVGYFYKITDFATVHIIPGTAVVNTGATEAIIVQAVAVNKLSPQASSTVYPQDILYYNVTNAAAPVGTTKGYIYRRIDTQRNVDLPFDYRAVKFRRYKCDLSSVGLANSYWMWSSAAVNLGYNVGTNAQYSFTGTAGDSIDVFALCNSATPDARNVYISSYYTETGATNWSPANYNFYFNGTSIFSVNLNGGFNLQFTLTAAGPINDISGGNISNTVWGGSDMIAAQYITPGIYKGIAGCIINYTTGNQCQWVYFNNFENSYINTDRLGDSKFESITKLSYTVFRGRNTQVRQVANLGIGNGADTLNGIDIESLGGSIATQNYAANRIDVYTGYDSGQDGGTYLVCKNGYSNIPFGYTITGLTTLNFQTPKNYLLGIAALASSNATEAIDTFSNIPNAQQWKVQPATGLTVTLTASATINLGLRVPAIVLNGTNGDYAIFKNIGGVAKIVAFVGTEVTTVDIAPSATPAINVLLAKQFRILALNTDITDFSANLTNIASLVEGEAFWVSFTDNGTPRNIAYGSSIENSTVTPPAITVASTRIDVKFSKNSATGKLRCLAVA